MSTGAAHSSIDSAPKRILLVEDDQTIAALELRILEKHGFAPRCCNTGEAAVETVALHPDIDLVLMDINLGEGIDGTEAARRILALREVPLIFLSSHDEWDTVDKTEGISSYGYVLKNSGTAVLLASIRMAFRLFDAQAKLNEQEKTLQTMRMAIENSLNAIAFADLDGAISYVNSAFLSLWGAESDSEVLGRDATDFWLNRDQAEAVVKEIGKSGSWTGDMVARRSDGSTFVSRLQSNFLHDSTGVPIGMMASFIDQTYCLDAENALEETARRLRLIIDSVPAGMAYVDASDLHYVFVNKSFANMFGFAPQDMEGITAPQVLGPSFAKARPFIERAQAGELVSYENQVPIMGEFRWFNVQYVPVKGRERTITHIIVLAIDIHAQKSMEVEIQKQLGEKELVLREVHHRIRNHIGSIEGFLALQSDSAANAEVRAALSEASGRVGSIRLIYDKLLLGGEYRDVAVRHYLEELLVAVTRISGQEGNVHISSNIDDFALDIRKVLSLGMIVNELVSNAVKYARIEGEICTVYVTLSHKAGEVCLKVWDDGPGYVLPEVLPEGHGFGLRLVEMLAQHLGGSYKFSSSDGGRFDLSFTK